MYMVSKVIIWISITLPGTIWLSIDNVGQLLVLYYSTTTPTYRLYYLQPITLQAHYLLRTIVTDMSLRFFFFFSCSVYHSQCLINMTW